MGSKKRRVINNRRDRRKAKASNWRREGRSNPKKVGHGGSGQVTGKSTKNNVPKDTTND